MNPALPISLRAAEIASAIQRHQVLILCGETGSGKTTQLPQICFNLGLAKNGLIGHTQPRRLAARSVAARIAHEMHVPLGDLVGAKVRFSDQTSRATRIKLLTDGMLLAELAGDPQLRAYSTLIIDEAHERSVNIDFLLGYLRSLLPKRPDLKLIITSATIDPARFSAFFGGPSIAPVIEVSGRTFPVDIRYKPTKFSDDSEFDRLDLHALVDACDELTRPDLPTDGGADVLVFLPGEREIRAAMDALRQSRTKAEVLALFGRLDAAEQDKVFEDHQHRRIILATNVAETSLTVPGVRYVVDTGFARLNRFDAERKVQRLPIEPISQASANQRSGRCGRVSHGIAIRLYSEESFLSRPRFTEPEILRSNLAGVLLQMHALKLGPVENFALLDVPALGAIADARETLFELGAVSGADVHATLTPIGQSLANLPIDPRIGRMLLAAPEHQSTREIVTLASGLSIQDPRERAMHSREQADRAHEVFKSPASDFLTLLNIFDQFTHALDDPSISAAEWCRSHHLSHARMREWLDTRAQLRSLATDLRLPVNDQPASADNIHKALLTGLISNVACREGPQGTHDYRGIRGNSVSIFPGSVLFKKSPKWIMPAEVVHTTKLYARTIAAIEPEWIESLASHMLQRQLSGKHLDPATAEPSAFARLSMSGVVIVPRRLISIASMDPAAARALFIRDALCSRLLARVLPSPPEFVTHNVRILDQADALEAKLRSRSVLASVDHLAEWFEARLPPIVVNPSSLLDWLSTSTTAHNQLLRLSLADVLRPGLAFDPAAFPDSLFLQTSSNTITLPLSYALSPGKDDDGITLSIPLEHLPDLTDDQAAWLVSGTLPELVLALFKSLPKSDRIKLESSQSLQAAAQACAGVMSFASGSLTASLSEALSVLFEITIDPDSFDLRHLPAHLRLRIRVIDDHARELAVDRDLPALRTRFAPALAKLRAARARNQFETSNLTTWSFDELPEFVDVDLAGTPARRAVALIDDGDSVRLTLIDDPIIARALTHRGLRALCALACLSEVEHHLASFPAWNDLKKWYQPLGTTLDLQQGLARHIAERTFLQGRSAPKNRQEFDDRLQQSWGKLAADTREVCTIVARILEARAKVAHRIASGTPRLWAASIADIREHAAYLMPNGFLLLILFDRLAQYPKFAELMRDRLLALREDGSGVETQSMAAFSPHWKRFTQHVAQSMAAHRDSDAESDPQTTADASRDASSAPRAPSGTAPRSASPLPQARRVSQKLNTDAALWALLPGNLSSAMETYRWALEDLRIALFSPGSAASSRPSTSDLDALWRKAIEPEASIRSNAKTTPR